MCASDPVHRCTDPNAEIIRKIYRHCGFVGLDSNQWLGCKINHFHIMYYSIFISFGKG